MKRSDNYLKLVYWSDEDQCYVGRSPGLFYGGVHGDNELVVFKEMVKVSESLNTYVVKALKKELGLSA